MNARSYKATSLPATTFRDFDISVNHVWFDRSAFFSSPYRNCIIILILFIYFIFGISHSVPILGFWRNSHTILILNWCFVKYLNSAGFIGRHFPGIEIQAVRNFRQRQLNSKIFSGFLKSTKVKDIPASIANSNIEIRNRKEIQEYNDITGP